MIVIKNTLLNSCFSFIHLSIHESPWELYNQCWQGGPQGLTVVLEMITFVDNFKIYLECIPLMC